MDSTTITSLFILTAFIFCLGLSFIIFASSAKKTGKNLLALTIVGWTLFALSIVGSVTLFVLFINENGGEFGLYLFIFISPLFFLVGIIICLAIGISSLTDGYQKNKEGMRDHSKIVRGWALLTLSILVIAAIVITLTILLTQYANYHNEHPVRFM